MSTQSMLRGVLCGALVVVSGCGSRAGTAGGGGDVQPGQLITGETIRESGLSTGWDILRRYGKHLNISEHERGPVRVTRRGRESIHLTESPLLIIDGVKVRDFRVLTTLPARDIESMRILSGAQGSVQHGLFAASGVIIVRTIHPDPHGTGAVADTSSARRVGAAVPRR